MNDVIAWLVLIGLLAAVFGGSLVVLMGIGLATPVAIGSALGITVLLPLLVFDEDEWADR